MKVKFNKQGETTSHLWRAGSVCVVPDDLAAKFIAEGIAEEYVEPELAIQPEHRTAVKKRGKSRVASVLKDRPTRDAASSDD